MSTCNGTSAFECDPSSSESEISELNAVYPVVNEIALPLIEERYFRCAA